GTAHGVYRGAPKIDFERVSAISEATGIPIVIHGGTGLSADTFRELIRRGAAKINVSTQIKITYTETLRTYLSSHSDGADPLRMLQQVRDSVEQVIGGYHEIFQSRGQAA